jgi:hypothetical protein
MLLEFSIPNLHIIEESETHALSSELVSPTLPLKERNPDLTKSPKIMTEDGLLCTVFAGYPMLIDTKSNEKPVVIVSTLEPMLILIMRVFNLPRPTRQSTPVSDIQKTLSERVYPKLQVAEINKTRFLPKIKTPVPVLGQFWR